MQGEAADTFVFCTPRLLKSGHITNDNVWVTMLWQVEHEAQRLTAAAVPMGPAKAGRQRIM